MSSWPTGMEAIKRNQIEYDDISPITADDVRADINAVRTMHVMAAQLVPQLPIFIG